MEPSDCINVVVHHFPHFLDLLTTLVNTRTVTTCKEATARGIALCQQLFADSLQPCGWSVNTDRSGNLVCAPPALDTSKPVLWLCAHIDTVDATRSKWQGEADPFECQDGATHLTGRGVNDCKAGVALMLWLAAQIAARRLPAFNGGFLVTRSEEAGSAHPRSAPQFARDMEEGRLQLSELPRGTFVLCLENTVSLRPTPRTRVGEDREGATTARVVYGPPEVGVYNRERHSFVFRARGTLSQLGEALQLLGNPDWKAVAVWPVDAAGERVDRSEEALAAWGGGALKEWTQEGGHSCTVKNTQTVVHKILSGTWSEVEGPERLVVWSGHSSKSSQVSSRVTTLCLPEVTTAAGEQQGAREQGEQEHALLLNYRGLSPVAEVLQQLQQLASALGPECLQEMANFAEGTGADQSEYVAGSFMAAALSKATAALEGHPELEWCRVVVKHEPNPGRSDSSHIWRTLPAQLRGHRVVPLTCGPGHRSHLDPVGRFPRKTHGVNEGYNKAEGLKSLPFFVMVVDAFVVR